MKKFIWLLPLFVVLILAGCGKNNATPTATNSPTVPAQNTINIQNFSFTPATLTIKAGTTVNWVNNDSATHQIQSADFNSEALAKGQTFSYTFDQAGTYDYSCVIHPSMTGKIIVQ